MSRGKLNLLLRLKPSTNLVPEHTFYKTTPTSTEIILTAPSSNQEHFHFSHVFDTDTTNTHLVQELSNPVVDQVLYGGNSLLGAFGGREAGKNHTIFGQKTADGYVGGLAQGIVKLLFEKLKSLSLERAPGILLSFFEIYQGNVRDLAISYTKKDDEAMKTDIAKIYTAQNLPVKEAFGKSYIEGVSLIQTVSPEEIYDLINSGFRQRETAERIYGKFSHQTTTVLSITVSQRTNTDSVAGKMYFVVLPSHEINSLEKQPGVPNEENE